MPEEVFSSTSVQRLPFDDIDDFSALFRDYCSRFEALADFYAGDYRDPEARRAAARRAVAVDRDRDTLADVLLEQNERWGLTDAVRANIEALRKEESAVVVTGQQVGILSGPLYTIYKTLSTIQLAEAWSEEMGRPIIPIFWLGAEDHDFEEISKITVLRRNDSHELQYPLPPEADDGNTGPVGRLVLGEAISGLVDELDDTLPPTDFKEAVMEMVRASYGAGTTSSDAFALLLRALFRETGLVLMNSDDARLKRLVVPLFEKEIDEAEEVAARVRTTSSSLPSRYHEQVQVRPSNLFYIDEDGRFPLDLEDDVYRLRGRDRTFTRRELREVLSETPERLSPNVVLRPLTQDLLLPTVAYVAGPSEVAYFAQYKGVYEWAGIPMPLIYPRASVTLVESKVDKVLEKFGLPIGDFAEDLDRLFQRVVLETMDIDVEAVFQDAGRHLHEAVNAVKPPLEEVDRTLVKAAEATRQALMEEFEKLKAKAVRLEKKNQDVVRSQLEKAQVNLYPGGKLQERALSILYFVNKYSLELVPDLLSVVSTDTTEHQIVHL